MGDGRFVRSAPFTVGGYNWAIRFYPDSFTDTPSYFAAAALELLTSNGEAEVRVRFDLRFVPQADIPDELVLPFMRQQVPVPPTTANGAGGSVARALCPTYGTRIFRSGALSLEEPDDIDIRRMQLLREHRKGLLVYSLAGDRLTIRCDLTVFRDRESQLSYGTSAAVRSEAIRVPPCDMMEHFGRLLRDKEGADVTFVVGDGGDTFEAHRVVLAARSPVFRAEFYGGEMRESRTRRVAVEDIQPAVFGALLHFIYNDSLPDMDDLLLKGNGEYGEMIRHLLVAADRYAMDRLKIMCQSILSKGLDVETVATTLALADRHGCDALRAACIKFITTSKEKDAVVATQGYADLKRDCPSVFVELFENASKIRNTT